jgi:uncharacterized coiled-coil DUF342 family protein
MADQDPPQEENKNGGRPRRQRDREDQVPVEELFDLSKPIPRVDRPDKNAHEKELAELTAKVDAVKEERAALQSKIDAAMDSDRGSAIGQKREEANKLRQKKQQLIEEKKAIRARLDAIRNQQDKLAKDRKDAKANVRYSNITDIDKELKRLQRLQETTSMTLTEEKKLIKEMDQLQASKKLVADLQDKESSIEDTKEARKALSAEISAKDKEIDAVQAEIDVVSEEIRKMSEKETDKRDGMKTLFNQRDELRQKVNDILKEKDALRDEYRKKNNDWYDYQRAIRAQKKIQYEEEKLRREAEKAEWLKKKEEEELKKIPYEEEMALCDYLADYLTRTYLAKSDNIEKYSVVKKEEVVAVKDDPFAGMVPANKKSDDEEYFGKGKGKKKRNRNKDKSTVGPFTLNMDTFEQFGLLSLDPPTSFEQVEKSVEDLKNKKIWYSKQPRGSVPTATEIRKANEKAAAKLKAKDTETSAPKPKKGDANFSLSSDDFAPLSASAGSASINASWGKAEEATAGDAPAEDPTPADASA